MVNISSSPKHEYVPAGTRYPTQAQAYRALLCDIMATLVEDVKRGDPAAVDYLDTPAFDWYCDALGLNPAAVRQRLLAQFGGERPRQVVYQPRGVWKDAAFVHTLYRQYRDEGLSVPTLAARYGMHVTTIYSRFSRMGLPMNRNPRKES